ncbi:hypothetical protein NMD12_12030 [Citrobacter portucalensis]|uniref:hypothetical protein n=1 Tax=Citrobacter portucalensis TaxID=1639133 RepID=UPI00351CE173
MQIKFHRYNWQPSHRLPVNLLSNLSWQAYTWSPDIQGYNIDVFRDNAECALDRWLEEAEKWVAMQNDPVEIIGHRFGGYLAQYLVAEHDTVNHVARSQT